MRDMRPNQGQMLVLTYVTTSISVTDSGYGGSPSAPSCLVLLWLGPKKSMYNLPSEQIFALSGSGRGIELGSWQRQ
jgi:hypothetical protein